MKLSLCVAVLIFVLDQMTKILVVQVMDLKSLIMIDVFPPYINFHMAWNKGVNFGLFSDDGDTMRWILTGFAVIISMMLFRWSAYTTNRRMHILVGLIIGGALGNGLDRAVYGAVADFLNMSCCGLNNPYAFNIADVAIFFGAVGLVLFPDKTKNNG